MGPVGFQPLQLEEMRSRLRKMRDVELVRFGRAALLSALSEFLLWMTRGGIREGTS
jgi:hypothetical protein